MGVASLLVTSAIGKGVEAEVRSGIEAAGSNLLVVRPAQVKRSAARRKLKGLVTTLRLDDYFAVRGLPLDHEAAPGLDASLRVEAGRGSALANLAGTAPTLARLRRLRIRRGRFFDDLDDAAASRVAVLGARVARTLFGEDDPVGAPLRVRDLPFEVIGVLEPRGIEADGSDQDGYVFIPVKTALRRVFNTRWLSTIFVSVSERRRMVEAESAIRELLRQRHGLAPGVPDDFAIQDQVKLLVVQQEAVVSLTRLTAGLAGASLIVGGTGILGLMFLSVKERTAEIGLRMAVGARPRDVLLQFLGEATLLAVGGWAAGAVVASAGGVLVAFGTGWKIAVPVGTLIQSFTMALVTGLGFGAFPARAAAALPPIRALASGS